MGDTVAAQLVGHEPHGFLSLTVQQSAEESPRCPRVPTGLYEDVDQITVLIHRAPEILALTVDRHEDFIQEPRISESTLSALQLPSVVGAEFPAPLPNGFVRHDDSSFGKQILNIPEAHAVSVVEPDGMADDFGRKAMPKLRVAGIRTSKERVRRFMREHDLQAPHRVGHAHGPKAHDGTITTEAPDAMWGTDMTATVTIGEGSAFVFVAVDHCTTECIGLHAAKSGSRFEALEPIRQGVRERFGAIGKGVAHGLRLRHDHGSAYLADDFQQEVAFFGIESSPSFVREPEGNGVAERFIRTLKENVLWVRSFDTIEELRLALLEFKRTYNEHWMLERYDYRSPAQVRRDLVGLDAAA